MNWLEMIALIAIVGTIGKVAQSYIEASRTRPLVAAAPPAQEDAEACRLRQEVAALKERIAVLERLATDDNAGCARLDREIEALRDRR